MPPLNIPFSAHQLVIPKYQPIVYLPTKCCERLIAIGDVHGCYEELGELWGLIKPTIRDCVVFLGDLVDRGPYSNKVVGFVQFYQDRIKYVYSVLGNHDEKHVRTEYQTF